MLAKGRAAALRSSRLRRSTRGPPWLVPFRATPPPRRRCRCSDRRAKISSSGVSTTKRKLHANAKSSTTFGEQVEVGDAPLPLRLVYTYRSPNVSLWKSSGTSGDPKNGSPLWPLTLLFGINAAVYGAWVWTPPEQDSDALRLAGETYTGVLNWKPEHTAHADGHVDFMERHFTVSVENLLQGRLHTLITSGFSHRDWKHLGGNMFALFLFGYRSCLALGPAPFLVLYMAGSVVCSSAHVMNNLYHDRMTPHLTQAELRGAFRDILRSIDKEASRHEVSARPALLSWLSFGNGKKAASAAQEYSLMPPSEVQEEGGGEDKHYERDLDLFERIGRGMTTVGFRAADLAHDFVGRFGGGNGAHNINQTTSSYSDEERRDGQVLEQSIMKQSSLTTRPTEERRVREIIKDRMPQAFEEQEEEESSEQRQSWWDAFRERRKIRALELAAAEERRRSALMQLARELVFQVYVTPRDVPSLGASGAVMAITNGSVLLFPRDLVVQGGVNIPLPVAAAMFTVSDLMGVVYPHPVDIVDHVGHLAGAGTGLLYVWTRWSFLRPAGRAAGGALPIVIQGRKIMEQWTKRHS